MHCGVTYESGRSLARGHVIRVWGERLMFDLSAVFDIIDHGIMPQILSERFNALEWTQSYISGHDCLC